MNIQIFGTSKCFDSKKAMRYFKERGIKYQWIDMKEKGLSKGEYTKVKQAVGGLDAMLNPKCKDQDTLALIKYIADDDKDEKVLENQQVLKTPIVRNGALATVGYSRCMERLEVGQDGTVLLSTDEQAETGSLSCHFAGNHSPGG